MPFGEIFTGTFQRIWRHKNLWWLAMLGLAFGALGSLIYALFAARWVGDYFNFMNLMMRGAMRGPSAGSFFMSSMTSVLAGAALAGLFGLIGYIVNLVARGAIIAEAAHAWRDEPTRASRGLSRGAGRAIYVFLIDLVWWIPVFLLILGGVVAFVVLVAGSAAASEANRGGGLIAASWLAFVCGGVCIGLLYYLVYAIFSPLMYQSAVAGNRGLGDALREGWTLARNNLGIMIIFWLLLLVVGFVLNLVLQSITTLFALPLWAGWLRSFSAAMAGAANGFWSGMPRMSGSLLALVVLISAILAFLVQSFTQTLGLTLFGGVYQRLAGTSAPEVGGLEPAPAPRVITVTPAVLPETAPPPAGPVVEPPPPPESEAPPTL